MKEIIWKNAWTWKILKLKNSENISKFSGMETILLSYNDLFSIKNV